MIVRIIDAKTMQVVDVPDVSQVLVFADTGEVVAATHETPGKTLISTHNGDSDFVPTLRGLGVTAKNIT